MRLKVGEGHYATVTVDEEIDLGALPAKFAAIRTMPGPTTLSELERNRLEQLFPVEQYDNDLHGPELRKR